VAAGDWKDVHELAKQWPMSEQAPSGRPAVSFDPEVFLTTQEATQLLKISTHHLHRLAKEGKLSHYRDNQNHNQWLKSEIFAYAQGRPRPGRPSFAISPQADKMADLLLAIGEDQDPAAILKELSLPPGASMRQLTAAMQKRIAALIFKHKAIEVLVAGLYSDDEKMRYLTAEALLHKAVPHMKAVELQHTTDDATLAQRQTALKILEEIAAQGRLQTQKKVRVIADEDAQIVK